MLYQSEQGCAATGISVPLSAFRTTIPEAHTGHSFRNTDNRWDARPTAIQPTFSGL
jgi:hypothetical protein